MSLHKEISEFATKRVEDMLKSPEMWGSQEAVELQVLQLMEIRMLIEHPLKLKINPRYVLDMHVTYISRAFKISYTKPMFSMHLEWKEFAAHLSQLWKSQPEE